MIQDKQIESAQHDVERMMEEKSVIDGQYVNINKKINKYQIDFNAAKESKRSPAMGCD